MSRENGSDVRASDIVTGLAAIRLRLAQHASRRNIASAAFLMGVLVMLSHRPFSQHEGGDTAFYDYVAQSVVRGQLPYRDVTDIKWPGAAYLSATAMLVGKPLGIRDVIAVRALNVLLVGLLSALIFLVADEYLRSREAAAVAFLFPLMTPRFVDWMVSGTEPKLPLLVFGMLTLLLIAKNRPLLAGFFSMLACLCWQPGLMFTGVAALMFSRYLTSWRGLQAVVKCLIGAIIPFAIMLLYFYYRGALADLWAWTITYNYGVFGPDANRGVVETLVHIWKVMNKILNADVAMVVLSAVGLVMFGVERIRVKFEARESFGSPDLFRDAILFPPLIYFAFCLINFQAGPDLIPLMPFVGVFAGKFIVDAGALVGSRLQKIRPSATPLQALIPRIVIGLLFALALFRGAIYRLEDGTIADQDKAFSAVSRLLEPDDKIYVHGTAELLVLLNRPNMNPYVFLDWGADEFAASRKGVDFSELITEMEAQAPKIVAISRLKMVSRRDDFTQWIARSYEELGAAQYLGIYLRKQQ